MAEEHLDMKSVLSFTTENSENVVKVITEIQTLLGDLAVSGIGAESSLKAAFKNLGKAIESIKGSAGGATKAIGDFGSTADKVARESVAGFQELIDKVRETTNELKDVAETHVVGGGLDPRKAVIKNMSLEEAKEILAIQEAQGTTAGRTAQRVVAAENRIQSAKKASVNLLREKARADMSETDAIQDKIKYLEQEQKTQQGKLGAAARYGDFEGEANAREALVKVNRELFNEQNNLKEATARATVELKEQGASLPTLRYAMYDVARTATVLTTAVTGLGAGALVASAKYESAFTAVERTSGVTGSAINELGDQFLGLTRDIPQTFEEITNIGARGAQLGVATEQLEDFTQVVAQFVATSDTVTLEESVEAFGRISNLMGDTNFSRIGSAITLVGVNAAATEAQIVKTTQELAPFATAVGMSTDEVIGLAAALGSLGQPPERARSAFLTLQRVMDTAISAGSENLNVFAQLIGRTADETAELWKQNPGEFVQAFARSLGSVEDLTGAFKALGINERRAVQVFQALAADARNSAGELSVLERAMADSSKGYEENTEMARQYALILDDLASRWQILKNAFMEFAASVGDVWAPIAKVVVDALSGIVQGLTALSKTDSGKALLTLVGILGGLVAVFGTMVALMATATASTFAMKTIMDGLGTSAGRASISIRSLNAQFTTLAGSVRGGAAALSTFKVALASTGVGIAILALGALAEKFIFAGQSAENTFNKYITTSEGLLEAVTADAQEYKNAVTSGNAGIADSFKTFATNALEASGESEGYSEAVKAAADILEYTLPRISAVNDALSEQTVVVGDNATEWLKQALVASEEFQKLTANPEFIESWKRMAIDFDEVLRISAEFGADGVEAYFISQASQFTDGANALLSGFNLFVYRVGQSLLSGFKVLKTLYWDNIGNLFSGGDIVDPAGATLGLAADLINTWSSPVLKKGFRDTAQVAGGLGQALKDVGRTAKQMQGDLDEDSLSDYEKGLNNVGNSASDAARKLRSVGDYANDLKKVFDRAFELRFGIEQVEDKTTKILLDIKKAAEQSADKIKDLRQSIRDLNTEIGVMESDLSKQKYFLSIAVEYGDVARQEAISAKIAKLEADIAGKKADRAKKEKDLTKEIEASSKKLTGNTEVAVKNRDTILGLVKSYQDQIVALANAGGSQKEVEALARQLRAEFVQQATQLGYNRTEVEKYAKTFDDLAKIIQKVPRNVSAELEIKGKNPAIAALREYEAALNSARANAGKGIGAPSYGASNLNAEIEGLKARIAALTAYMNNMVRVGNASGAIRISDEIARITNELRRVRGWADGGFTGRGGKYDYAGPAHRGEFIFPKEAVNQATGLPYTDALGRMMAMQGAPVGHVASQQASTSGVSMVALTPGTVQQIANAVKPHLYLDSDKIASASATAYANNTKIGAF